MKKILFCAVLLVLSVTACKKDPSQLSFSLENLTKLVNRSPDYIKHASPGDIKSVEDDYLVFNLFNEIDGMNIAYLFYGFEDNKATEIDIIPNQVDNLDYAKLFMTLAENELGSYLMYHLEYLNDNSESQTKEFTSFQGLWDFVSSESLSASEIEEIIGYYVIDKYVILAGGFYYIGSSSSYFQPLLEVVEATTVTGSKNSDELLKNTFDKGLYLRAVK